ncbi:hypothetical protein CYMTET_43246 [Cymbomonas tetramitiformis]|uniref:Uncharacterized protein n=1 Tax=Cymbomonas tetramitiformis TaxID=36881 RepID=A0AAE0C473_9CHLO|nr:hypothetical protein CYMTET_43246 [Cymbomonas tetramitiformis]
MAFGELLVDRALLVPAGACGRDWARSEFEGVCDDPLLYQLKATVTAYDPTVSLAKRYTIKFEYDESVYQKDETFVLRYLEGDAPQIPPVACRALVLSAPQVGDNPAVPAQPATAEVLRARPRAAGRKRLRKSGEIVVVEVESEDEDAGMEDDEEREEEEPSAGEAADLSKGELFLGKYDVQWKEAGVAFDQRAKCGFEEDDPKIRWERVANVNTSIMDTKFFRYFCVFFPVSILDWWCKDITLKGREKYGNRFLTGNRDFTPGLFFVFIGDFFYMAVNPGLPRSAYFDSVAEFPYVAHNRAVPG